MKRWYLGVVVTAVGLVACGAPVEEAIPEPEPMAAEPADSALGGRARPPLTRAPPRLCSADKKREPPPIPFLPINMS